jgi:hypothetical protein
MEFVRSRPLFLRREMRMGCRVCQDVEKAP